MGAEAIAAPHDCGTPESTGSPVTIAVRDVSRRFREKVALSDVSLSLRAGDIHALLGPNGAGKTTLVRVLSGLLAPTSGSVAIHGIDSSRHPVALRRLVGLVPSGDRTFYLRLSGLENLAFFGRLQGLRRRAALARAREVLGDVGLLDAADEHVGVYSHGMQKRLSVARALLHDPIVLLVDEATHDLDPEGARRVRELVRAAAGRGATVIWTTQRVEEIRGFADGVTLLDHGSVRFSGSVPALLAQATPQRYLLRLRNGKPAGADLSAELALALGGRGATARATGADAEHYLLALQDDVVLGEALAALTAAGVQILACREERSEVEDAFLMLTKGGSS
jgi:ABC-type multidrug transport system ATPase subunit